MIITPSQRLNRVEEYYFSKKLDEIRRLNQQGYQIINLGIGSPDLMPSGSTLDALHFSSKNPRHHGYQPYKGIPELRKAISEWYHKVYSVRLDPETEILPLMGSKEGITHISLAFLDPGDKVLIPELGYPAYGAVTRMAGAEPVLYPLEETTWYPDFEFLESIPPRSVKLLWMNYPHMPTGAAPSADLFIKLIDWANRKKILLCHDNPYSLILNETPPISLLFLEGSSEVAVELNSMSKSFNMAGWRVGWVSGKKDYINSILQIKSNFDSGMFRGIQDAAVEALKNPDSWHEQRNQIYRERRDLVWKLLDRLGCDYRKNQVGLFIWAKVPDTIEDVEKWVDHILYHHQVFITPGFIFGKKGNRFVRVSLCAEKQIFEEAIFRIRDLNF